MQLKGQRNSCSPHFYSTFFIGWGIAISLSWAPQPLSRLKNILRTFMYMGKQKVLTISKLTEHLGGIFWRAFELKHRTALSAISICKTLPMLLLFRFHVPAVACKLVTYPFFNGVFCCCKHPRKLGFSWLSYSFCKCLFSHWQVSDIYIHLMLFPGWLVCLSRSVSSTV